ncbi:hypothetical protein KP509_21G008600 [Ceratopteris richardii]|uniref:Uncharacterized protein n=1 Tax=Ceratopteris richardii TaxID=49495 RepID=A0A8T2S8K3_CERRI|nr:hypothetical protein KP509_21G008600 [Ceratopteris richardii]
MSVVLLNQRRKDTALKRAMLNISGEKKSSARSPGFSLHAFVFSPILFHAFVFSPILFLVSRITSSLWIHISSLRVLHSVGCSAEEVPQFHRKRTYQKIKERIEKATHRRENNWFCILIRQENYG